MTDTAQGIHAALLAAQKKFPDIKKTELAETRNFSYRYATLPDVMDTLRPVLHENDILVTQPTKATPSEVTLETTLHHVPSGQEITASVLMPIPTDPQAWGSAMTYLRRYCLMSICGVAPDDDDDGARAQAVSNRASAPRSTSNASRQFDTCPEHNLQWRPTARGNNAHPIKQGGELVGWCDEDEFKARGALGDAEQLDRDAQAHLGEA